MQTVKLNEKTLHDLIAAHLQAMNVIPDCRDVTDIHVTPNNDGLYTIEFNTQPKEEVIFHE